MKYADISSVNNGGVLYPEDTVVREAGVATIKNIVDKVGSDVRGAMHPCDERYGIEDRMEALEKALRYAMDALSGIDTALSLGRGGVVGRDGDTSISFWGIMSGAVIDRDDSFSAHT